LSSNLLLLVILAAPFLGAAVAAGLPRHARTAAAILSWLVSLVSLVSLAALWPRFADGEVLRLAIPWPLRSLCLVLTFLAGPVGFLIYLVGRAVLRRTVAAEDGVSSAAGFPAASA
jgi:hypothetical protein